MSHIALNENIKVDDIDALEKAVNSIPGLEFVRDQKGYRWYGSTRIWTDDQHSQYNKLTASAPGSCEHAIRLKEGDAYEVGVVRDRDGHYNLFYDDFDDFRAKNQGTLKRILGGNQQNLFAKYIDTVASNQFGREVTGQWHEGKYKLTISLDGAVGHADNAQEEYGYSERSF